MGNAALIRQFRFSLRTLFVAVTVFAVWFGYQWNWIRERRTAVARRDYPELSVVLTEEDDGLYELARPKPFVLWLFRQPTYARVYVNFEPRSSVVDAQQVDELRRLMKLFPEAQVALDYNAGLTLRPQPNLPILPTQPPPDPAGDPFNP